MNTPSPVISGPITWTCMVCNQRQQDLNIAVTSTTVATVGRIEVKVSIRYCRTNSRCRNEAITMLQERADLIRGIASEHGL